MRTTEQAVRHIVYSSSIHPDVTTVDSELAPIIAWADENPVAWDIVMGTRSKAFGRNSSFYLGMLQGSTSPSAVLSRLVSYFKELNRYGEDDNFHTWKAKFTFKHYHDKGFKGGMFVQFDGKYDRGCSILDYAPGTLADVTDRFVQWCGPMFRTVSVKIDGRVVRTY